jgi:hypothetical protein
MKKLQTFAVLATAACCGLAAPLSQAADDEPIATDRPDFVESSQVVGKGRIQLETSVAHERDRDHVRTWSTPTLLRIGVGDSSELRIETDGRTVVHEGGRSTAGYADSALGVKWHLADQGTGGFPGQPSLGVLAHVDLPSGGRGFKGRGLRPSLRLAAEWELADGYAFGVMPGLATGSTEDGKRYGYGILAATLGKELNERLRGFVELAAPQVARPRFGGTQASFDTGLAWLVNKDCQLDVSLARGLNRNTPDLSVAVGLSVRH